MPTFLQDYTDVGITVNSTLSWSDHIKSVYIKFNCARKIGRLKRLKRKLHPSAFERIYTGAIRPKMEYACTVWSGGPTSKLVDLQRTLCRRHNIQLPSLQKRFDYFTLALFFLKYTYTKPQIPCTNFCLLLHPLRVTLFEKSTLFQQLTDPRR